MQSLRPLLMLTGIQYPEKEILLESICPCLNVREGVRGCSGARSRDPRTNISQGQYARPLADVLSAWHDRHRRSASLQSEQHGEPRPAGANDLYGCVQPTAGEHSDIHDRQRQRRVLAIPVGAVDHHGDAALLESVRPEWRIKGDVEQLRNGDQWRNRI